MKKDIALLLILFLTSFWLRVTLMGQGPYHIDCLNLALQAEKTIATHQLQPLFGFGYPLIVLLAAFFIGLTKIFGNQDPVIAVNLMSAFFGALCIPAAYAFLKKIIDEQTALFSSVLLSLFPLFLSLSTFGMSHTTTIFFLLLGLNFLAGYKRSQKRHLFFLSGIVFGLMGACRAQDLILMSPPIAFFYWAFPWEYSLAKKHPSSFLQKISKFSRWGLLIFIVTVIFHLPFLGGHQSQNYAQQFQQFWKIGVTWNFQGLLWPMLLSTGTTIIHELSLPGILLTLSGLVLLLTKNRKAFFFFLLWFVAPIFFYGNAFTMTPRLLLLPLVSLIFLAGYCFAVLAQSRNRITQLLSLGIFVFLIITSLNRILPVLIFRHQNAVMPELSLWVGQVTEPDAKILACDEFLFLNHYAHRQTMFWPVNYYSSVQDFSQFRSWLNQELADKKDFYIILGRNYSLKANQDFKNFLFKNYHLKLMGERRYEDWHHSTTEMQVGKIDFYKIESSRVDASKSGW